MAEITTTQTMGNKTITTTINTAARGPVGATGPAGETGPAGAQGPAGATGATGPAGSDATVTAANTLTALQAMTTAQEASSRESIAAQSRSVGFLNRFGRLAEATAVATGSTPEVGENVFIHWGSGSANPTVVSEALEAAAGTLIYYGANVASPGNRFTITIMAEIRVNSGYTSGSSAPDLTIGINSRAWSSVGGLASFLAAPSPLHAQIRTTGEVGGDFYVDPPSVTRDDSSDTSRAIGAGFKFPITLDVDGPNDIVRITVAGRTFVFRDSRYSRCVDETQTGFFVEWGAPSTADQYYWCIHSIAVNAPELSDSNSFEGGQYGRQIHNLVTRDTATLPSRQRILGGAVAFTGEMGVGNANDPYAIAGNPHIGYAPYFRPAPYATARVMGISDRATAKLESVAPSANVALHAIQSLPTLASYTGNQLGNGSWAVTTYFIRLGANTNTKRLRIIRDAGGATRFDSGDFTGAAGNNVQAVLRFYQYKHSAGWRYVTVLEWSIPGSSTPYRIQTYSEDATAAVSDRLYVTGTALGDVTIDHHWTEVSPVP